MNYVRNYFLVLLSVIMVFFSIIGSSQSSRISYELSYKPDPTQKDNIVKRNYTLDIFNGESIFRTEMRKESDSIIIKKGFGSGYNTNPNYELYLTKDLNSHSLKLR